VTDLNPAPAAHSVADFQRPVGFKNSRRVFKKDRAANCRGKTNRPRSPLTAQNCSKPSRRTTAPEKTPRQIRPVLLRAHDGYPHGKGHALQRLPFYNDSHRQQRFCTTKFRAASNQILRRIATDADESLVPKRSKNQIELRCTATDARPPPAAPEGGTNLLGLADARSAPRVSKSCANRARNPS